MDPQPGRGRAQRHRRACQQPQRHRGRERTRLRVQVSTGAPPAPPSSQRRRGLGFKGHAPPRLVLLCVLQTIIRQSDAGVSKGKKTRQLSVLVLSALLEVLVHRRTKAAGELRRGRPPSGRVHPLLLVNVPPSSRGFQAKVGAGGLLLKPPQVPSWVCGTRM